VFDPAGDFATTTTNVEAALYELDGRLSKNHLADDLSGSGAPGDPLGSMTIVDDFMGTSTLSGRIGSLGWSIALGAPGTVESAFLTSAPGIVRLKSGTTFVPNPGNPATPPYMAVNLGNSNLKGCPAFIQETRCRLETLGDATVIFPLAVLPVPVTVSETDLTPVIAEPASGCYFSYTAASAEWQAVCSSGGVSLKQPVGVADTAWHRFRIISDPTASGGPQVRFYVDGVLKATFTTNLPAATAFCSPVIGLYKTGGTTERKLLVDYFALRWEIAR
jgi:hypothetical protein